MEEEIKKLKNENFRLLDTLNCEKELNADLERKIDSLLKEKEKEKDKETIYKLAMKIAGI